VPEFLHGCCCNVGLRSFAKARARTAGHDGTATSGPRREWRAGWRAQGNSVLPRSALHEHSLPPSASMSAGSAGTPRSRTRSTMQTKPSGSSFAAGTGAAYRERRTRSRMGRSHVRGRPGRPSRTAQDHDRVRVLVSLERRIAAGRYLEVPNHETQLTLRRRPHPTTPGGLRRGGAGLSSL
jgi:hypothetical protein